MSDVAEGPRPERPVRRAARLRRRLRRLTEVAALSLAAVTLMVLSCMAAMRAGARGHIHTVETVPQAPVALVLGAQVYDGGQPSPFLVQRLVIAQRLFAAGKVRAILVSGDHGRWEYNEPGAMYGWLRERGVPSNKVVLDHAGFDTYDSCARANRIFGVTRAIVVTQTYHLARAVTLCRSLGIDADGVGDDTARQWFGPWVLSAGREPGASVKAVFDLPSGRDPVFLGRRETSLDEALSGA